MVNTVEISFAECECGDICFNSATKYKLCMSLIPVSYLIIPQYLPSMKVCARPDTTSDRLTD